MFVALINVWQVRVLAICLLVLIAERRYPWRIEQPMVRPQWYQDLFWFIFNAFAFSAVAGPLFSQIGAAWKWLFSLAFGIGAGSVHLLSDLPFYLQMPLALLVIDLVEWVAHNLLHRVPFLWRFHRVHHSIVHMDWIGNFRFHPLEILFYFTLKYIPLALLGVSAETAVAVGSVSLLVGNLNHSNLKISWGLLRYFLNSPRMHIWHHDAMLRGAAGVNFGITLSLWDWLFGTAYMPPDGAPERLGFEGDNRFPRQLWRRLGLPFLDVSQ